MSNLPNPNKFTSHQVTFAHTERSQTDAKAYDLEQIDKSFKTALKACNPLRKRELSNELISYSFWKSTPNINAKKYFGYSKKYDSLTVHLYDDAGEVQTIAIRNADGTKWKTYGSKKFTPYKIRHEVIFITSGMAEIIINDIMSLSFIGMQSDSMVIHLPKQLRELARDKYIIILADNDISFKKIIPGIKQFFEHSQTIVIDFGKLLNRELPKGYDFRDFINEVGDASKVLKMIQDEITKGGV